MHSKEIWVISDVDEVLRANKKMIAPELDSVIQSVRSTTPMTFVMITGAPLTHLPDIDCDIAFAESGGVQKIANESIRVHRNVQYAIDRIRDALALETIDGLAEVCGEQLIVEGIRYCTLTLLAGAPTHYPFPAHGSLDPVRRFTRSWRDGEPTQSVAFFDGCTKAYEWIDIVPTAITKEATVRKLYDTYAPRRIYYLGDGANDLATMRLPFITPIAFENSIPEIKELAERRGTYIPRHAVHEFGAYTFFDMLGNGHI